MPLSDLDHCSQALIKIGANAIQSFGEGTAEAAVAAALYPTLRDGLLSAHHWNFALGQKKLARLAATPVADYDYAYQLPSDMVTILSLGTNERGRGLEYRRAEGRLHTDAEEVWLTYIFRAAESLFPPYFSLALIARLAAEFAIPLTESTTRWQGLSAIAAAEFSRARLRDAQEDTPPRFEDFTLVEVRG